MSIYTAARYSAKIIRGGEKVPPRNTVTYALVDTVLCDRTTRNRSLKVGIDIVLTEETVLRFLPGADVHVNDLILFEDTTWYKVKSIPKDSYRMNEIITPVEAAQLVTYQ